MGIFGTYGAFQGLGKPSIKLEFEDNESLVNFSKRMQEGEAAPVTWNEEEEMFVPVEGVELSETAFRNLFNKPEKFRHINYTDIDNDFPEYIYVNYPNTLRKAFKVKTPLKGGEKFVYVFADLEHLKYDNSTNQDREDIIGLLKPTLEDPDIVFESDGENNFVKAFKSNSGQFIIFSFIPTVKGKNGFMKTQFIKDFGKIYKKYKKDGCKLKYTHPPINFNGSLGELNEQPIYFVELRLPCADKVSNNISDHQIFNENSLGAPGDAFIVTDTRTNGRKPLNEMAAFKRFSVEPVADVSDGGANSADSGVILIPVASLNFDTKNFQNREDEYSQTSVDRIIDAVEDGDFNWAVFDPITVWKNPDNGKYYVLSGHSRSEAFRRLALQNAQAQGRKFDKIPAKVFKGTFEQAKELALNSNTLSTKETDLERANYYRDRREKLLAQGVKPSEVKKRLLELAKKNEGKNANKIIYMSYLDPRGIVADAVKNLAASSGQDRERIAVVAEWIGHLRYMFPQLTTMHENELYRFLVTSGHYGADIRNFADFAKRVQTAIEKHTEWGQFHADQSLDMERNMGKSENERRYDAELARLKQEWTDAENTLTRKLGEFKARQKKDSRITDEQIINAVRPYKDNALVAKAEYLAFRDKRGDYLKADERQMSLFGRTANPAIYNNNDIMECRGFVPTYTILDDYSSFFEQAKTHTEFAGFGLDDTLKLITDICRKHWKDCAKIAQHLKGDCKLQSAFNLWHWMRYNIRYEYDREGREEVRTPLRVWADRHRGVDCDCLSVFAYCVLRCMGYNPAFELVAFRNKPQYSHIFINLDGIVVDRVWFIFNSRPPMVTKSTIYRINDINDLGKLF